MSEPSPRTGTSAATAWGFLAPGLILISLSVLIPAAMALVMSFTQSGLGQMMAIEGGDPTRRALLDEAMAQRDQASMETRITWLTRIGHAVFMCRDAVQDICSVTGASGSRLENPIQRAMRDITTGSNHVIFDRESRYADYGRLLLGQPPQNPLA